MNTYHKIQTVYLRDPATNYKTLLEGQWAKPEFEYLADNTWVFEEKVDGTNIRIIYTPSTGLHFAGKEDNAQIPQELESRLHDIFIPQLDTFAKKFPHGVCIYGEGYGNKIQSKGKLYSPTQEFIVFDVFIGGYWLNQMNKMDVASTFGLQVVPFAPLATGTLYDGIDLVRKGFKSVWGDFMAEGIIARPLTELYNRSGERVITKIKHVDFKR